MLPPQVIDAIERGEEQLGYYTSAFTVTGSAISQIEMLDSNTSDIETVSNEKLVELIQLNGSSNKNSLDSAAMAIAKPLLERPHVNRHERILYLRPQPNVHTDGLISNVEITSRRGMIGFNTHVIIGRTNKPFISGNKTRVRSKPVDDMPKGTTLPEENNG